MSAFDRNWQANWIWAPGVGAPSASVFQLDLPPRPPDTIVLFRRSFELADVPVSAPARVTADGRYQLFVNGTRVGRGPIRSEPSHLAWDEYDLAPHLTTGNNTIAVLARNFGQATLYWKPAKPVGQLGFGSLVLEARVGDELITTDGSWRTELAPYARAQPGQWAGPPAVEILDGRALPPDWTHTDFDDSAWTPATELKLAGLGIHRDAPPSDPFGLMAASEVGQLAEHVVRPQRLVGRGEAMTLGTPTKDHVRAPISTGGHPLDLLAADGLGRLADEPAPDSLALSAGHWVTLDFGAITNSHPVLHLDAEPGTVIDITVGEDLNDNATPVVAPRRWSMRYTAAGHGDEAVEALEPVGFRYLQVIVRAGNTRSIQPHALYRHYPRPSGPTFGCDDDALNDLWRLGVQTLDACSVDAFLDCPGREQRAWMGDAYVESLVSLTANADTGLVTHNAELLRQGVRSDGLRPMTGGADFSDSVATIPDFSLHWIRTVARIHEHLGDVAFVETMWPRILDALSWFEWHRGDNDLLVDLTGWIWVDWAQTGRGRNVAAIDALYALALDDAAALADALDEAGSAGRLRERAARSRAAFEAYWNEERGVYVDAADPVTGRGIRVSQQTNTLAILSGAAPRARWDRMLDHVLDGERLFHTRHPGDGGPQVNRLLYQWMPAQEFGGGRLMDEATEVVLAQPFFCHFLHQALAVAGRMDDLLASTRRWEALAARGDEVFQEYWEHVPGHGSRCHAWSATPTYDLTTHVLGVRRASVGWTSVTIQPWFGPLTELEGTVPTPLGDIQVELRKGGGGWVILPDGMTGTYSLDGIEVGLQPGKQDVPA